MCNFFEFVEGKTTYIINKEHIVVVFQFDDGRLEVHLDVEDLGPFYIPVESAKAFQEWLLL